MQWRDQDRQLSGEHGQSWSADERWVYFNSDRTGRWEIWKKSTQGGQAVQLTQGGGMIPIEGHGGRFVYYVKEEASEGLWRVPIDGGEETPVLERLGYWDWCLWRGNRTVIVATRTIGVRI